jgi:hypothetical protein
MLAAAVLGPFGYWGLNTVAGRARFDEMAGIIPLAAMAGAGLLAVVGAGLLLYSVFRTQ